MFTAPKVEIWGDSLTSLQTFTHYIIDKQILYCIDHKLFYHTFAYELLHSLL